ALEYDHWDKALRIDRNTNWPAALKNGVALMTLVGTVDEAQASEALIARDPLYQRAKDVDAPRVSSALMRLFPGRNDGLAGLEPDLIGEQHVAKTVTDELVDACLEWAGGDRARRQQIFTVLNRSTRAEHGDVAKAAEGQLSRLVATHAETL